MVLSIRSFDKGYSKVNWISPVLVCLGFLIPQGGINNINVFSHNSGCSKPKAKVPARMALDDLSPWACRWWSSHSILTWPFLCEVGERGFSSSSYKNTNPIRLVVSPLWLHFGLNYFLLGLIPNTVTLGFKVSTYEFEGEGTQFSPKQFQPSDTYSVERLQRTTISDDIYIYIFPGSMIRKIAY